MATAQDRQYDLILYGATGYTGKYTAEYIVKSQPTTLRWAIAGRSANKLESLINDLKPLNPDRAAPSIETSSLDLQDLKSLAKKTRVIINSVGPYSFYGKNVVQACAEEGTGYVDTTGEVPWVKDMIEQFESTAKKTGAVIIPQSGFESAIPDILAYAVTAHIRKTRNAPTKSVTSVLWDLKSQPSGGTLATILSLFSVYSLKQVAAAMTPYSISPTAAPAHKKTSFLTQLSNALFGVRTLPHLGLATTAVTGSTNAAIVQRSWGLRPDFYGRSFKYDELAAVRNRLRGFAVHWGLAMGGLAVALPPTRWLIKQFVFKPGEGPSKESTLNDFAEYRSVGVPEGKEEDVVKGRLYYKGSMYDLSGVLMTEVAASLLDGNLEAVKEGGFATPATLGEGLLERVRKAGIEVEVEG